MAKGGKETFCVGRSRGMNTSCEIATLAGVMALVPRSVLPLLISALWSSANGALLPASAVPAQTVALRSCGVGVLCCGSRVVSRAHAVMLEAEGQQVAEWCVSAGRAEATIAVSPATTTAGVLRDFWVGARTFAEEEGPRGRQRIIALPKWEEGASNPKLFERLLTHITDCADICEYVGDSLLVAGRHPAARPNDDEPQSVPYPIIVLRSFRQKAWKDFAADNFGADDPFEQLPDEAMDAAPGSRGWPDDAEVMASTRAWVEGVIVKMKVCPFANSADVAGLPTGGVTYPLSHGTTAEQIYEAFWNQVLELAATDHKTIATVLLLTPRFALHSPGGFDVLADTLNTCLTTLNVERDIQLVFFHPEYAFRDGKDRIGADGAANYARRSPYPMINLLRTKQVREAQKGLPTGSVYTTNENNLEVVGADKLQEALESRDWGVVFEHEYASHRDNLWE